MGNQGISGGKNIGDQFRDIYPSHIGRIDLNGVSHGKNTALTGFLTPKCKIYGNGFFSEYSYDPDNFSSNMKNLRKLIKDRKIDDRKVQILELKEVKNKYYNSLMNMKNLEKRDGKFVIHARNSYRKHLDTNQYIIAPRNPDIFYKPLYRNEAGLLLNEDNKFFIARRSKPIIENGKFVIRSKKAVIKARKKCE